MLTKAYQKGLPMGLEKARQTGLQMEPQKAFPKVKQMVRKTGLQMEEMTASLMVKQKGQ